MYAVVEVAPFMGAWIEIRRNQYMRSLVDVAPFMGAWIEIASKSSTQRTSPCRTLHRCVDRNGAIDSKGDIPCCLTLRFRSNFTFFEMRD